jgi:hypothetical protein
MFRAPVIGYREKVMAHKAKPRVNCLVPFTASFGDNLICLAVSNAVTIEQNV